MSVSRDRSEPLFDDEFLRRLEVLYLAARRVAQGTQQATRRSRKLGAGVDVADFRPYVGGDDVRHIDWNYYGSTRDLLIRLFEEEEDLHIYFLLDTSSSMFIGSEERFRYAARLVAALGYIGLSNLDRVSVVPFSSTTGKRLPAARGRAQIWKVLRFLETIEPGTTTDMEASFREFVNSTSRRGLAVVVSDFFDPAGVERGLNMLRYSRFETILFQLGSDADRSPRLGGEIELRDRETQQTVRMRVTASTLRRYQDAYDAQIAELGAIARKHQSLYFRAPIELPFDDLVLRVLRAGGFLR